MSANVVIGPGTEFLTSGREYLHDREHTMFKTVVLASTARKGGNPVIPKGHALGKITASGKYQEYDNDDSDGTEVFRGFLDQEIDLRDSEGAVQDATVQMCVFGRVKAANVSWEDSANDITAAKADAANGDNGSFFIWD